MPRMAEIPQFQGIQQLGRTYRAFRAAFDADIGHSTLRWRILLALYRSCECSQKQLAQELPMDPASLTRQIKAIERMGWIERHADPADNRVTNVALTANGRDIVQSKLPQRAAFIENAFGDLSLHQLAELSAKIGRAHV